MNLEQRIEALEKLLQPKIKWANLRKLDDPNFHVPFDKRREDAGYDVWARVKPDQINSKGEIYINAVQGKTTLIPLGFATAFDENYVLSLKHERSSVGSKSIFVSAGLIDSGFRNEWQLCVTPIAYDVVITNTVDEAEIVDKGTRRVLYYPYSKAIAQVTVNLNLDSSTEKIDYDDLLNIKSDRGLGGFGSTN